MVLLPNSNNQGKLIIWVPGRIGYVLPHLPNKGNYSQKIHLNSNVRYKKLYLLVLNALCGFIGS